MAIVGKYHKEVSANLEIYVGDVHVDLVDENTIKFSQAAGIEPRHNFIFFSAKAAKELRDILNELLDQQERN